MYLEDEIVFFQPFGVRFYQRGRCVGQLPLHSFLCTLLKLGTRDPPVCKLHQGIPVSGEWNLIDDAHYSVVVVFDLTFQSLSARERERFDSIDYRRTFKANIGRWARLERWLAPPGA